MRELYNEFFHIPKDGKIREKAMLAHTAITVVVMLICLAAMSITAYAYFSYNVTSGSNVIKAANFEAQVTVNDGTADVSLTDEGKIQTAILPAGTYTVNLSKGDSTANTGFCIVTIGGEKYHTAQIGEDVARNLTDASSVTFTLKVSAETEITILSHWGTSSFYGYKDIDNPFYIKAMDSVIDLTTAVNSVEESPLNEGQGSTDETTSTETTPTEVIHTVSADETISAIAAKYGVTVKQIAAYNGITDPNYIQGGQQLKIPPADYEVPADTTEQTTTTPETTAPTTETTQPADPAAPETTGTSEPTDTTEPSASTTESITTQPTETSANETTGTDSTEQTQPATETSETTGAPTTESTETTEPSTSTTESTATQPTETTEPETTGTETQPTTENTETTGTPTTEASE